MMRWMRKHLTRDEGFTLIELMVVVLIIAVLVAIAIPSFLGFRSNAQNRAAQSEVRNTLLAEKGYFTENNAFTATAASLQAFEPSISLASDPADGVVATLNGTSIVCLTRTSDAGNTYAVWESSAGGTYYGETDLSASGACGTTAPGTYVQGGWN
jgi:type IV pilus assembly protein PilA